MDGGWGGDGMVMAVPVAAWLALLGVSCWMLVAKMWKIWSSWPVAVCFSLWCFDVLCGYGVKFIARMFDHRCACSIWDHV